MSRWKGIKFNWDFITSKDDSEAIPVCLTWAERQILLTIIDPIAWLTRWDGAAEQDTIDEWRDSIGLKLTGECEVDCADVIACITDGTYDGDLAEWLIDIILSNSELNETVYSGGEGGSTALDSAGDDIISFASGCDPDATFAFARQLVQFMNSAVENAFQIFEAITNYAELLAAASESVPVLTTVTDYLSWSQDNLFENYLANYDTALENEIACKLFCMAMDDDDCELTWTQIRIALANEAYAGFTGSGISDWLQWVITGTYDGDELVYSALATFAIVIEYGCDWAGITLAQVQRIVQSLLNDEDDDWETLCNDCVWEKEFDFTTDEAGFEAVYIDDAWEDRALYVTATHWKNNTTAADVYDEIRIVNDSFPDTTINVTEVEVEYDSGAQIYAFNVWLGESNQVELGTLPSGTTQVEEKEAVGTILDGYFRLDMTNGLETDNNLKLRKLTLRGTGVDPWA